MPIVDNPLLIVPPPLQIHTQCGAEKVTENASQQTDNFTETSLSATQIDGILQNTIALSQLPHEMQMPNQALDVQQSTERRVAKIVCLYHA